MCIILQPYLTDWENFLADWVISILSLWLLLNVLVQHCNFKVISEKTHFCLYLPLIIPIILLSFVASYRCHHCNTVGCVCTSPQKQSKCWQLGRGDGRIHRVLGVAHHTISLFSSAAVQDSSLQRAVLTPDHSLVTRGMHFVNQLPPSAVLM